MPNGHVLILPGVENFPWTFWGVLKGLRKGGVSRRVWVRNWGVRPFGTFPNLMRYRLNRRKIAGIATEVLHLAESQPGARITLIGYSGGGGMALFLAEALPEDFRFERIILVAPAVSPLYELGAALARSRRGVLSYYSPRDSFFLGWGTRTFGTMDRVRINAAGRYGFLNARANCGGTRGFRK